MIRSKDRSTGRPAPCLLFGAAMLAAPALALVAPDHSGAGAEAPLTLQAILILVAGAGSALLAITRPGGTAPAPFAVLCAAGALMFAHPAPWVAGLSGSAALGFLMSMGLHAEATGSHVDNEEWISAHLPMLQGAAVTAPAAVAAVLVPSGWSYPVAGLIGVSIAGLCAVVIPSGP